MVDGGKGRRRQADVVKQRDGSVTGWHPALGSCHVKFLLLPPIKTAQPPITSSPFHHPLFSVPLSSSLAANPLFYCYLSFHLSPHVSFLILSSTAFSLGHSQGRWEVVFAQKSSFFTWLQLSETVLPSYVLFSLSSFKSISRVIVLVLIIDFHHMIA